MCWSRSRIGSGIQRREEVEAAGRAVEMGRDGGLYCLLVLLGWVSPGCAVDGGEPRDNERIVDTHPTFSLFFMRRRHRRTPDCGPLCHRDTPGRSTRHGRRINRQEADERHREIDVDGVVERDAECVGDVDEFGPADG